MVPDFGGWRGRCSEQHPERGLPGRPCPGNAGEKLTVPSKRLTDAVRPVYFFLGPRIERRRMRQNIGPAQYEQQELKNRAVTRVFAPGGQNSAAGRQEGRA